MKLRYSERIGETMLLGPKKRAVIWVFGCCFDCEGCIAKNYRFGKSRIEETDALAAWFLQTGAEGLTISGGEPFLQPAALYALITAIRSKRPLDVIVYTGFVYADLLRNQDPDVQAFLSEIDLLIDGPYIDAENHNEPYRGSANQNIILLTDRLKTEAAEYYGKAKGRKIEIQAHMDGTMMIGVPSREQALLWQRLREMGDASGGQSDSVN